MDRGDEKKPLNVGELGLNEIKCEECGETISVPDDAEEGELIECAACAVEYEVICLNPLELEKFEEDEK